MELWLFLLRWIHFLAGITWIGILYYFNFVQTPFFAETDPAVRSGAIQKLVPRALWWFRWGAMFTFLSGLLIYLHKLAQAGVAGFFSTSYGWAITVGGTLGTIMFLNVWLVIWPNQKVVIASTTQVAQGGQAIPEAAGRARRAALTSRTNTLFSVPMLFYMGAASHLTLFGEASPKAMLGMTIIGGLIVAAIEANALIGLQGETKKPLDTVSGTLWAGFILSAILYLLFWILF
ncbi:antitermination protein NusG [bacterium]|nr:MAG: antitermination protein NusG [bacterium]